MNRTECEDNESVHGYFLREMAIESNEYCIIHLQEKNRRELKKLKNIFATYENNSESCTNENHISMADIDYNINAQNGSTKPTQYSKKGKFVCDICGKEHLGGHVAKGIQKAVGNTIMGVFGTLTFLTGGLTAPLMLGAGMGGAALSGSAEQYSICSECRNK